MHNNLIKFFSTLNTNPSKILFVLVAILRGFFVKIKYRLLNRKNIIIGKRFRLFSKIKIIGPGKVIIGDRFTCNITACKIPCIITHTKDAKVVIGHDNYLGGTQISCIRQIEIGNNVLMANSTIIDSINVPYPNLEITSDWIKLYSAPIKIGDRCWLGANSMVLKGVNLGYECVLSAGSVATQSAEPLSLLMGNPARKIGITREASQ